MNLPVAWQHYRRLLAALRRHHPRALAQLGMISLVVCLISSASILTPWLLKQSLDQLQDQQHWPGILTISAYALCWGASQVAFFWKNTLAASLSASFECGLGLALFEHRIRQPWRTHNPQEPAGETLAIFRRVAGSVGALTCNLSWGLLPIVIELIGAAWLLTLSQGGQIALVLLLTMAAFFGCSLLTVRVARDVTRDIHHESTRLSGHLQERLGLIPTLQLNNAQTQAMQQASQYCTRWQDAVIRGNRRLGTLYAGKILLISAGLLLSTLAIQQGHGSLGDLVMLNAYMIQFAMPMTWLAGSLFDMQRHLLALEEGVRWLSTDCQPSRPALHPALPATLQVAALQVGSGAPLSFSVPPGQWLGLTGPSGTGKSRVLDALLKLSGYQGSICLGTCCAETCSDETWHALVTGVRQQPQLLAGSLRDNLTLGLSQPVDAQLLQRACYLACLDRLIADKPEGWEHPVSPEGGNLSGGERMRLAIARALLHQPAVLILDEPTAALDSETERQLLARLRSSGLTIIVASHSAYCLQQCEQILSLGPAEGRIHDNNGLLPCDQTHEHG
ncbi:ABC transporter ATP-binding protein/permease [Paludibacterium sp. THUN1379]|uniref:ABC transporter ATP-binding protein n=1 Tax=Paludibacterium sp. THUN1379 TaxID=3112107 RepID=UPI00308BA1E8|nr:ABC transporter ATP-binding protein/permease [Paludibacterium sp. THUN1379]